MDDPLHSAPFRFAMVCPVDGSPLLSSIWTQRIKRLTRSCTNTIRRSLAVDPLGCGNNVLATVYIFYGQSGHSTGTPRYTDHDGTNCADHHLGGCCLCHIC